MTEPFKICKIIILYMLDQADVPLTTSEISDFILSGQYTNYFTLQQSISELLDSDFIRAENEQTKTFYHLTEEGRNSLGFFKNDISPEILADVDNYLKDKDYELKSQASVKAEYYEITKDAETTSHEYAVRCQVIEQGTPLIDLTIKVPSENEAKEVAENWEHKNQEIYARIMAELL